ncbi:hypothetical protein PLUA15_80021 [Pseudomonas lundensis]|uniref:Uncharacterized protein n=1 Tax=Pseudomonas lundensis TaxID=86185 RepID=A0AAX2HE44_9PSED|nr:hypothetical protein PLUA15_80021 [Pseudomonas lundensis]
MRVDAQGIKVAGVKVGSPGLPVPGSPKALSGLLQGACQFLQRAHKKMTTDEKAPDSGAFLSGRRL